MLPLNVTTVEKNLNAKDLEQKMADNICFAVKHVRERLENHKHH